MRVHVLKRAKGITCGGINFMVNDRQSHQLPSWSETRGIHANVTRASRACLLRTSYREASGAKRVDRNASLIRRVR